MPDAKIVVRRAVMTDYDDVLAIDRDVYGGFDYVPARYPQFVTDPDVDMSVAEVDGHIVS